MNDDVIKKLQRLSQYLNTHKSSLVIDGDTHPTNLSRLEGEVKNKFYESENYYQGRPISIENLLAEMLLAKVDMALTWQNPAALTYTQDLDSNYAKLLQANKDICTFAERHPDKFIPAGWTDPKALGLPNAIKLVDQCVTELALPIVKMNPAQNAYPIDSKEVRIVVDKIISLGATPAFHYGGDSPYTPAEGLEKLALHYSPYPIIGVHMGGGGSHYVEGEQIYQESRQLGLRCPNLFFILSAKRDCHIESDLISYTLAGEPFCNNLACGSDAPYGKPSWNFGGFVRMFEGLKNGQCYPDPRVKKVPGLFTDEIIQGYMGRNLANLVINTCERILEKERTFVKV